MSDPKLSSKKSKRCRRFEYMRQREATQQEYKIGVINTPEELLQPKKQSESTQPAPLLL